jgi:hypothetical protein
MSARHNALKIFNGSHIEVTVNDIPMVIPKIELTFQYLTDGNGGERVSLFQRGNPIWNNLSPTLISNNDDSGNAFADTAAIKTYLVTNLAAK